MLFCPSSSNSPACAAGQTVERHLHCHSRSILVLLGTAAALPALISLTMGQRQLCWHRSCSRVSRAGLGASTANRGKSHLGTTHRAAPLAQASPGSLAPSKRLSGKCLKYTLYCEIQYLRRGIKVIKTSPKLCSVPLVSLLPIPAASCPGRVCICRETGSGEKSSARWPSSYAELRSPPLRAPKSAWNS